MNNKVIITMYGESSTESVENTPGGGKVLTFENVGVSDTYHTFDELYDHRIELFIQLCYQKWYHEVACNNGRNNIWRSKKHSDGELAFGGSWFVLGINKEEGEQITYHLPISRWEDTDFAETLETAPPYDGHTPNDVLERLKTI